jgi:hypothetical protein
MDNFYSEEEASIVKKFYGKIPVREIKRLYLSNRSEGSIRGKATRLGLSSNITHQKIRYEPELLNVNEMTFEELWEASYVFQRAAHGLSTRYEDVDVYIDTDEIIGVPFIADLHIGAISTPLDAVRERFFILAENEWLYPIGVGDKIDNYLPTRHPQGMFGTMFPPELQKELIENLYSQVKGRWIALVQGCHDDFSHQVDDFDFTKYMAHRMGCVNLGFGGMINLHVGEQTYKIAVRHKYRYNSSLNPTNACRRLVQLEYPNADIACVAHNHITEILQVDHRDKDRIYIRPGSMKQPDRYGRSLGFISTGSSMPIVLLWPNKRQMQPFQDFNSAVDIYNLVNR